MKLILHRLRQVMLPTLSLWLPSATLYATPIFEPLQAFIRSGEKPQGNLIQGSDGNFYGTTREGGSSNSGTAFKMTPSGTLTTLVNFTGVNGSYPATGLVESSDGNFYGTTPGAGYNGYSTVFRITPSGTLAILAYHMNFLGNISSGLVQGSDGNFYFMTSGGGGSPIRVMKITASGTLTTLGTFPGDSRGSSTLIQASDGDFYGTTSGISTTDYGRIFKMTTTGTVTTLVTFKGLNGSSPSSLMQGSDGNFYGTTHQGGTSGSGTVFKMTPTGTLTTLVNFTGASGRNPRAGLVQDSDGDFYGTTSGGDGSSFYGTIFKMTDSGTLTTLVSFSETNGRSPYAGLIHGNDGDFYGTTRSGGILQTGTVFKVSPSGTLTTLANFSEANGSLLTAELVQASDGCFYGTTLTGGTSGKGTLFKMTYNGTLTKLVDFNGTNGSLPSAALVQGSDGNFYGTTSRGGTTDKGTVFKVTNTGMLTTLVNFAGSDGSDPKAALIQSSDGNFYGTTVLGGSNNTGTAFMMTPSGTLTTLLNFTGANGGHPRAALIQGDDGDFYGTTNIGGTSGNGTVFKMTATGTLTTLVNFEGGLTAANGNRPEAGLVLGSDGNFYGTTSRGGTNLLGTVFMMTHTGTLTTLVDLIGSNKGRPSSVLVQSSDGNFYGTTSASSGNGTVFMMTPSGTLTTLVYFNGADGSSPRAGLVRGNDGHLYGTTYGGGTTSEGVIAGAGQIYRLRMGPGVTTQAASIITTNSATLNGTVNPRGYDTSVSFQYGTDPTLATFSTASAGTLPAEIIDMPVETAISGLSPGTTYYFRILASNVENTVPQYGAILSFPDTYSSWAATWFTSSQLADPLVSGPHADPDRDGIVNLIESAFNTHPLIAGNQILVADTGTVGLPNITTIGSGTMTRLRIEYIRRISGYTYLPLVSSDLESNGWNAPTGTPTVTPIDEVWERVVIEDTAGSGQPTRFGRVMVLSGD